MTAKAKVYLKLQGNGNDFDIESFQAALGQQLNIAATEVEIPYIAEDNLFLEVVLPETAAHQLYDYVHSENGFTARSYANTRATAEVNGSGQTQMSDSQINTTPAEDTTHATVIEAKLEPIIEPVAPQVEDLPPKDAAPIVDAENEGLPAPEVAIESQLEA